ncbi:MAG: hypothetical protein LUC33_03130 [Prevotellaceae bacterium]|nr:hypothetical protein [Prevotellaceae bacterium]
MAVINNPELEAGEVIQQQTGTVDKSQGTVGLSTQIPNQAATVSALESANGGIAPGNLVESDLDQELYKYKSDETPLMQLMLAARARQVTSPVVEHFSIDEPKGYVTVTEDVTGGKSRVSLPMDEGDARIPSIGDTLYCKGVDGYDATGQSLTVGKCVMLYVTGRSDETGYPIVMAVNGQRETAESETTTVPDIPGGTECVLMSNAMYETQKWVEPSLMSPVGEMVYLQKRGMNQVVSDYFESQKKHIPFSKALIAEYMLTHFKTMCNRSLWLGVKGILYVKTKLGIQSVYFSDGVRHMFKREMMHTGQWDYDEFIALTKMFFTGEDVPTTALCLCGKNFLEGIQKIDWSKHPEVHIELKKNEAMGWKVTSFTTVFGELQFKREPTLDRIGLSNSCGIFGENRLVHYQRVGEHSFNEQVEGEEATRNGLIRWDALALKGACHIWVDGDSQEVTEAAEGVVKTVLWTDDTVPESPVEGVVYYFLQNVDLGDAGTAKSGECWKYTSDGGWTLYSGVIKAA